MNKKIMTEDGEVDEEVYKLLQSRCKPFPKEKIIVESTPNKDMQYLKKWIDREELNG